MTGEDQVNWLSMLETDAVEFDRGRAIVPKAATGRFGPTNWVCGYFEVGKNGRVRSP